LDPIRALVYTAVINGIVAVPILIALMKVASDKKILNDHINSLTSNVISWITIGIMGIAVAILLFTWGQQ
jgi:Mn2+/Fe2+ NRAMP family transporter